MNNFGIQIRSFKVADLVAWQRNGGLTLSPNFQRKAVWKSGAKSFLIDTLIRGLPAPIIFIREKITDLKTLSAKREVIDGQQRLRTIFSYIDSTLVEDYDQKKDDFLLQANHNSQHGNKRYADLDAEAKQAILDYEFSVHTLPSSVADSQILEIFARLNSTGVKLNDQELRNAEFFGEFKSTVYSLATEQLERWRTWKVLTEDDIARMQEAELTSEFLILIEDGISGKSQKRISSFYKKYDETFPRKAEFAKRFRAVMDSIETGLGQELYALPFRKKTLFYTLFAYIYDYQFGLGSALVKQKAHSVPPKVFRHIVEKGRSINHGRAPRKVLKACERRTTHPESRKVLIEYIKTP